MSERLVETEAGRSMLIRYIQEHPLPFICATIKGKRRSLDQNRLQRLWCNEIAEARGDVTPEEVRGYCKLALGVPIMRAGSAKWAEEYDFVLKPLSYEAKLRLMMEPLDYPVTRRMTTKQMKQYLDDICQHFAQQGIQLTQPDWMGWAA